MPNTPIDLGELLVLAARDCQNQVIAHQGSIAMSYLRKAAHRAVQLGDPELLRLFENLELVEQPAQKRGAA